MFDYKSILNERPALSPIPTPVPAEFPHDDTVPEGCKILTGLKDDWGYHVDLHTDVLYVERKSSNWKVPLKMHIFEPKAHFGSNADDMAKKRLWPCIALVQGLSFPRTVAVE